MTNIRTSQIGSFHQGLGSKKIATWVYGILFQIWPSTSPVYTVSLSTHFPVLDKCTWGEKVSCPQAVEVKWSWAASIILSWCCWAIVTQIIPLFDQHEGQVKIGTRGTCIIWSTMLDTPRKSRMVDHVIIFLCPYNLKKEVWPFVTWKTTWIQEKTGSKILPWMKQPTVMLWHHHPEKLEPLIGCENTSGKLNMLETICVKPCPQRSISEIETTTPPGVPRYLSTFRSLPCPQAPSVPLSLWATVSTGASSSETWLVFFLRFKPWGKSSFGVNPFVTFVKGHFLEDSFDPPKNVGTKKCWFLDIRKPRYLDFHKKAGMLWTSFGISCNFLKISGKKMMLSLNFLANNLDFWRSPRSTPTINSPIHLEDWFVFCLPQSLYTKKYKVVNLTFSTYVGMFQNQGTLLSSLGHWWRYQFKNWDISYLKTISFNGYDSVVIR